MPVDYVHDLQNVYRQLLDSMARPGKINELLKEPERSNENLPCFDATLLTALTLLDGEVTFYIISGQQAELADKFSSYTLAKQTEIDEADFIFAMQDAPIQAILEGLDCCKCGSLENPQHSATWLIESNTLTNDPSVTLTGPGIQHYETLQTEVPQTIWAKRNAISQEFPLGIDMIFIDDKARTACVPRSTIVDCGVA
ncbi:phosphonate C-P lyase system protein PhnH [Lentibacillus amyloliquefaciens]|uniref:Phosphonate C-P lyase system protein PhnH n=1 Tax=Lentibacillus amyloliquefaciens TaxID=1472767 RepID=A0A0U4FB40_9BACI|nr:phosphonate C-P lyase system protein PhnH [Lentibacillus amyloliquefaciens]ALX50019.1 hypothetical protein AOX59_16395 [Lentibacillus amyloliquefaciens]